MSGPGHRRKQRLKRRAHRYIDRIVNEGIASRRRVYRTMVRHMGLTPEECHFAKMTLAQMKRAMAIIRYEFL